MFLKISLLHTPTDKLWLMIILLSIGTAAIVLIKLHAALLSITSKCGQYICSIPVPKSINGGVMNINDMSFFKPLPKSRLSGYLLVKIQEPVSTCSEDEEVTKPVQEAGNGTKIKMDPWPGLQRCTFGLSRHGRLEASVAQSTLMEAATTVSRGCFLPETWFW